MRCRHGSTHKSLSTLLRHKLVHHENVNYDGYRLTYMGYDFLAINTLMKRGLISSVGRQIGVGKESDIFEVRRAVCSTPIAMCSVQSCAVKSDLPCAPPGIRSI